jgi:hypothetical protein
MHLKDNPEVMKKIGQAIKDYGVVHKSLEGVYYIREDTILQAISEIELPFETIDEETIEQTMNKNLLPLADNGWRKEHPDKWNWEEDNLKRVSKMLAHAIAESFVSKKEEVNRELLEVCKGFVTWFDYISKYQSECLGKGFKEACENWDNMIIPSPNIDKMRQAISKAEGKEG